MRTSASTRRCRRPTGRTTSSPRAPTAPSRLPSCSPDREPPDQRTNGRPQAALDDTALQRRWKGAASRAMAGGEAAERDEASCDLGGAAVLEELVGGSQGGLVDVAGLVLEDPGPVGARAPHGEGHGV